MERGGEEARREASKLRSALELEAVKLKDGKEREDKLQKEASASADALKALEVQSANETFSLNNRVASLSSEVSSLRETNASLTAAAQSQGGAGEALKGRLADALKEAEAARQEVRGWACFVCVRACAHERSFTSRRRL